MKYFSKIVASLVMFIALLGTMKNNILYTVYEYDRSFFIESFCVNKDRPQLHCNGKCKLAQMRKEDDEKKASDMMGNLQTDVAYFFPARPIVLMCHKPIIAREVDSDPPIYKNYLYSYLFISKSVKPPETA